jgi:hypothetical protein
VKRPPVDIDATTMTAWSEIYVSHPAGCDCPSCLAMDAMLFEIATGGDL